MKTTNAYICKFKPKLQLVENRQNELLNFASWNQQKLYKELAGEVVVGWGLNEKRPLTKTSKTYPRLIAFQNITSTNPAFSPQSPNSTLIFFLFFSISILSGKPFFSQYFPCIQTSSSTNKRIQWASFLVSVCLTSSWIGRNQGWGNQLTSCAEKFHKSVKLKETSLFLYEFLSIFFWGDDDDVNNENVHNKKTNNKNYVMIDDDDDDDDDDGNFNDFDYQTDVHNGLRNIYISIKWTIYIFSYFFIYHLLRLIDWF